MEECTFKPLMRAKSVRRDETKMSNVKQFLKEQDEFEENKKNKRQERELLVHLKE